MNEKLIIKSILDLISEGKLSEAIELLKENSEDQTEISIQSSRYIELNRKIRLNVIGEVDANIERNKIKLSVLEIADSLKQDKIKSHSNNNYSRSTLFQIIFAFCAILIFIVFLFLYHKINYKQNLFNKQLEDSTPSFHENDKKNNYKTKNAQIENSSSFAPKTNQLTGTIVDLNNKGIKGVEVQLESKGDFTYTDQYGNFKFNGEFKMAEPLYSFLLFKEGYVTVGKSNEKKVIFTSGNIGHIIMKEDTEKYLWVTVIDTVSIELLQDVEIDILGMQGITNKNGKAKFDLSGLRKETVFATFQKECYKDQLKRLKSSGEEVVNLTFNCKPNKKNSPTVNQLIGTIVDLNNKGIEGVEVRLESTGDSKYTDRDGNFVFNGEFKMAEPLYSFELYKEGYIPVGNTHQKKPIFIKGNIENIVMKEATEKYLWITVVDAESLVFLKDVEIDIFGRQEKTNRSGKAKFDLSGLGKNTVNASFLKKCYQDELTQVNTKGEEIVKLINICKDPDNPPPRLEEDLTTDIVGKYKVKSHFLNFNMGLDMDREYEIEIKKKNNNTVTILDKVDMIFLKIPISYDVELSKSNDLLLFAIPEQTDVNQTVKGTGHSTHAAHGEFSKKTGKIDFSYVVSDVSANRKYNIVGFKKD